MVSSERFLHSIYDLDVHVCGDKLGLYEKCEKVFYVLHLETTALLRNLSN